MKKVLVTMSIIGLSITSINGLTQSINTYTINSKNQEQENESIFKPINWQEVRQTINDTFKIISLNKIYSDDTQEMLKQAKIKTLEYLEEFEKQDSSYEEVIIKTKNQSSDFKKEYEKNWDDTIGTTIGANEWSGGPKGNWLGEWMGGYKGKWLGSSGTSWSQPPIKEWIEPPLEELPDGIKKGRPILLPVSEESRKQILEIFSRIEMIGRISSSLSVATGLIAAGFWALAWFGGISVPWAVAATTASATLGVVSATISCFLTLIKDEINRVKLEPLDKAIRLGLAVMMIAKTVLLADSVMASVVLTSTSWAVPFIFGIIGLIIEVGSWIYWVNPDIIPTKIYLKTFNNKVNFKKGVY